MSTFVARTATEADLSAVLSWLEAEYEWTSLVQTGSFWHNRNVIEEAHQVGDLFVLAVEDRVAGFLVGSKTGDLSMMEIRPELRGHGLGQQLVEHYLDLIEEAGAIGAYVHCMPDSSIRFWKKLGFRPYFDLAQIPPEQVGPFTIQPPDADRLALIFPPQRPPLTQMGTVLIEIASVSHSEGPPITPPFRTGAVRVGSDWVLVKPFCEYFRSVSSRLRVNIDGRIHWCEDVQYIDDIGGERYGRMVRLGCITPVMESV